MTAEALGAGICPVMTLLAEGCSNGLMAQTALGGDDARLVAIV